MVVSDLFVWISLAAASLFIISSSASYIINAISDFARKTGLSDYLIGFVIVSAATSLPELSTGIIASLSNNGSLALGNVIGSNINDVTVILGLTAIIGKKIFVHGKVLTKTVITILFMASLPLLLGWDGQISRIDGLICLVSFAFYIYKLVVQEGKFGHVKPDINIGLIWIDFAVIGLAVGALLMSTNWLLISTKNISEILNIDPFFAGLVILGSATTIPELTIALKSVIRGTSGIAFGDVLGSVVNNSSLVIGITALINPIEVTVGPFISSALFMISTVYIAILFIMKKSIDWEEGLGLLLIYVTFIVREYLANFS
jgi:cation:H+ antiporter